MVGQTPCAFNSWPTVANSGLSAPHIELTCSDMAEDNLTTWLFSIMGKPISNTNSNSPLLSLSFQSVCLETRRKWVGLLVFSVGPEDSRRVATKLFIPAETFCRCWVFPSLFSGRFHWMVDDSLSHIPLWVRWYVHLGTSSRRGRLTLTVHSYKHYMFYHAIGLYRIWTYPSNLIEKLGWLDELAPTSLP